MSVGGSKSSGSTQQQSSTNQALDPDIKSALLGNYANAQKLVSGSSYQPITSSAITGFENPYNQSVIDTTNNDLNLQREQELTQNAATATAANAYGGDRGAVSDALTNEAADRTMASTDAGLSAANYTQALGAAQTQNAAQNAYPLSLQELLNASLGLAGNPVLSQSQSTGSSQNSSVQASFAK